MELYQRVINQILLYAEEHFVVDYMYMCTHFIFTE